MLRALEIIHIRRRDEVLCRLQIARAYRSAPMRPIVVPKGLQDVPLIVDLAVHGPSNVANRDGKDAFPRCADSARVTPPLLEGVFSAGSGGTAVVIEAGDGVGVEGGVDDVLDGDAGPIALPKLIGSWSEVGPSPFVGVDCQVIDFLPVVEVPCFVVAADHLILRAPPYALVVTTCAAAHNEYFLGAI